MMIFVGFCMLAAMRGSSNLLAHESAFALGRIQDVEAVPALEKVLNDLSVHPIVCHELCKSTVLVRFELLLPADASSFPLHNSLLWQHELCSLPVHCFGRPPSTLHCRISQESSAVEASSGLSSLSGHLRRSLSRPLQSLLSRKFPFESEENGLHRSASHRIEPSVAVESGSSSILLQTARSPQAIIARILYRLGAGQRT